MTSNLNERVDLEDFTRYLMEEWATPEGWTFTAQDIDALYALAEPDPDAFDKALKIAAKQGKITNATNYLKAVLRNRLKQQVARTGQREAEYGHLLGRTP